MKKERKDEKTKKQVEGAGSGEKVNEKTVKADDEVAGQTPGASTKPQEGEEGAEAPVKKKKHKKKKKEAATSLRDDSEDELGGSPRDELQPQVEKEGGEKSADKTAPPTDTEKSEVKLPEKKPGDSPPEERLPEISRDTGKEVKEAGKQDAGAVRAENGDDGLEDGRKEKRLHVCALCGEAETIPKSFKRCQK